MIATPIIEIIKIIKIIDKKEHFCFEGAVSAQGKVLFLTSVKAGEKKT